MPTGEDTSKMAENQSETRISSRILFFESVGGVSGDMCLGGLVDLGLPLDILTSKLSQLGLDDRFRIEVVPCTVGAIEASRAAVKLTQVDHHHRHLSDVRSIIEKSGLPSTIQERALGIFERLAEAEAKVHGTTPDKVHFHEVGAVDAIVDIVGTCIGIEYFSPEQIFYSPLVTGRGTVESAHGIIPVPAPAVLNLVTGSTLRYLDVDAELTTPTGAAILTALGEERTSTEFRVDRVGYGSGHRETPGVLIVLRVILGTATAHQ